MYKAYRQWCERVLRIPGTPEPPPGDEATTRLFQAAPNYYKYLLVLWLLRTLVVVALVLPAELLPLIEPMSNALERSLRGFHLFAISVPLLLLAFVCLQRLFALALLRLDFEKRWYLVTNRSLRVREGIVGVREMTISFANIQNISVSQGPIQRLLGIADLRVDTAGGGGSQKKEHAGRENTHGVHFRGVNNAAEIRELINKRLRELKDSGLGDIDDAAHASPATPLPTADLVAPLREIAAEAGALRHAVAQTHV
ncbi:hypothetical protein BH18VER1_BH18VER1_13760 [soil metagenome]